ncbi:MAG TPA: ATP-grasp domain-containing protein [Erysipelotrichaceae bacterium]|nr:ATP-grasp domain-containing protein [Erysipelotrichaceae bacterium]
MSKNIIYKGLRILIAEGRARQCLPLIRSFKKQGCIVAALCRSKLDVAYASRYTDKRIIGVCDDEKEEETTSQIRNLLKTGEYDIVVPTTDFIARILSKNKIEFSKYAKIASNDWEIFQLAGDKSKTMEICMKNDIPCPSTLLDVKCLEDILNSTIAFPIVMKPKVGFGAIGFKVVKSKEEMIKLSPLIHDYGSYVFQEYIPQTDIQYECAMFIDNDNNVKTSVVFSKNRWFPISGGSSTLNITVDRPDIIESCKKLLQLINWRGAADVDFIQDPRDGIAKIMEINPRVSGSVKITFDAGTDQGLQMIQLLLGNDVTDFNKYEYGRRLRCSQTDLLWFIKSPNRFKSKPSWFSNYKTRDQIFYWSDPWPYFAFSLSGLFRYKREMKKRS